MTKSALAAASAALLAALCVAVPVGAQDRLPAEAADRTGQTAPPAYAGAAGSNMEFDGWSGPAESQLDGRAVADGWLSSSVTPRGARTVRFGPGAAGFRPAMETLAAQLRTEVGINITVGSNLTSNRAPLSGEILVLVGAGSCGQDVACTTPQSDRGTILIDPTMVALAATDRQHILAAGLGFNYGIRLHSNRYLDTYQVMRNVVLDDVYVNAQYTFQAGDINGLRSKWSAGGGAAPTGSGATPGAPAGFGLRRKPGAVAVAWTTPGWRGASVTQYQVETKVGSAAATHRTVTTRGTVVSGLANGTPVQVRVRARNASGWGPWSAAQSATPRPAVGRFANVEAVSAWTNTNLGLSFPTSSLNWWRTRLASGDSDFTEMIQVAVSRYSDLRDLGAVYRLYQAYFLRSPDSAGLDYWGQRRVDGTGLAVVSQGFSASPEFRNTYGRLSNVQFVDLVYRNVLGRPADAAGRTYWTNELNRGTPRGRVMIGFSESPEYRSITAVDRYCAIWGRALLRTIPPKAKRDQCSTALRNGSARYGDRLEVYLYDSTFR